METVWKHVRPWWENIFSKSFLLQDYLTLKGKCGNKEFQFDWLSNHLPSTGHPTPNHAKGQRVMVAQSKWQGIKYLSDLRVIRVKLNSLQVMWKESIACSFLHSFNCFLGISYVWNAGNIETWSLSSWTICKLQLLLIFQFPYLYNWVNMSIFLMELLWGQNELKHSNAQLRNFADSALN